MKIRIFQSLSIQNLVRWFFVISFSLLVGVLLYLGYLTFLADYQATVARANLSNLKKLQEIEKEIIQGLHSDYEKIAEICTFDNRKDLVDFQKNNESKIKNLNREFMHETDYQKYLDGQLQVAVDVRPFHLSRPAWITAKNSIAGLFSDKEIMFHYYETPMKRSKNPLAIEIAGMKIKPIFKEDRRSIYLSREDFKKLDAADGYLDDRITHQEIEEQWQRKIFHFNSDRFSWSPIGIDPGKEQVMRGDRGVGMERQAPLLWAISFIYRKTGLLGIVPHTYMKLIEKGLRFRPQNYRKKIFHLSKYAITWNWFPTDYNPTVIKDVNPLYPEKVIAATIDDQLLLRRLLHQHLDQVETKSRTMMILGQGQGELFKKSTQNQVKRKLESSPDWFTRHLKDFGRIKGSYLNFTHSDNKDSFFTTIYESSLALPTLMVLSQPQREFLNGLYLRWSAYILMIILAIFSIQKLVRIRLKNFESSIGNCLGYILDETPGAHKTDTEDEFQHLKNKLQEFNSAIHSRFEFFKLNSLFHQAIQTPRQTLAFYYDEFKYLCSDVAERFRFQPRTQTHSENSQNRVDLNLTKEQQFSLEEVLGQAGPVSLEFPLPISDEENSIFQKHFQFIIDKSEVEKELIHSDKLKADLELARVLQQGLSPRNTRYEIGEIEIHCSVRRSQCMDFDCMDIQQKGDQLHFYIFDLSRQGVGSALISTYIKSYLDGLKRYQQEPKELLHGLNEFLCKEDFEDLFVSLFLGVLDLKSWKLKYSSAGTPCFFWDSGGEISNPTVSNPPLGIQSNIQFKQDTLTFEASQQAYFFSNGLWFERDAGGLAGYNSLKEAYTKFSNLRPDEMLSKLATGLDSSENLKDDCLQAVFEFHES